MAQVRSHYDQIEALNSEVVVVSFEAGQLAQAWLADTGIPFTLLLDPSRQAYQAFGLERSLVRSWGPRNLWYYTRALLGGRHFYGIGTDTAQLGGDFVIEARGIVRLVHPSRDPTDRPSVAALLAALRQLQNNAV